MPESYASPEGYGGAAWLNPPLPIRYRIRRAEFAGGVRPVPFMLSAEEAFPPYTLGEVEEHCTLQSFDYIKRAWYHGLALKDQFFADRCVGLVQEACAYFYEPDETYAPMAGVDAIVVSDAEIERRIAQLDDGENTREAIRSSKRRYPLRELPADQQRALVERLEQLRLEFGFEKLGPVDASDGRAQVGPPPAYYGGED